MALIGNNLRRAALALEPVETPPSRLSDLVGQLVNDAKMQGTRGFGGSSDVQSVRELRTRAAAVAPSITREEADLAAEIAAKALERAKARTELVMKVVVTVFCLTAGTIVLLTQEDETLKKWASGIVGTAIGYWLG